MKIFSMKTSSGIKWQLNLIFVLFATGANATFIGLGEIGNLLGMASSGLGGESGISGIGNIISGVISSAGKGGEDSSTNAIGSIVNSGLNVAKSLASSLSKTTNDISSKNSNQFSTSSSQNTFTNNVNSYPPVRECNNCLMQNTLPPPIPLPPPTIQECSVCVIRNNLPPLRRRRQSEELQDLPITSKIPSPPSPPPQKSTDTQNF